MECRLLYNTSHIQSGSRLLKLYLLYNLYQPFIVFYLSSLLFSSACELFSPGSDLLILVSSYDANAGSTIAILFATIFDIIPTPSFATTIAIATCIIPKIMTDSNIFSCSSYFLIDSINTYRIKNVENIREYIITISLQRVISPDKQISWMIKHINTPLNRSG